MIILQKLLQLLQIKLKNVYSESFFDYCHKKIEVLIILEILETIKVRHNNRYS